MTKKRAAIKAANTYSTDGTKGGLSLVVLTPDQKAEIIEYVNWDSTGMLACGLGFQLDRLIDGIGFDEWWASNPEGHLHDVMDAIARHREVHQVMLAIGAHARTLSHAYTIVAHKPPYVDKQFGDLSGVVMSMCEEGATDLSDRCRRMALRGATQEDREVVSKLRRRAAAAFYGACRAYSDTRRAERAARRVSAYRRPAPAVPHICRCSTVYPCPCGGGVAR